MVTPHWLELILTTALVVLGGFQVLVYFRQVAIMDKQADIAANQFNAAIRLDRPYMWISAIPAARSESDDVATGIAHYSMINYGKTPALIEFMCWGLQVVENFDGSPDYTKCTETSGDVVYEAGRYRPSANTPGGAPTDPDYRAGYATKKTDISEAQKAAIRSGKAFLVFVGIVRYKSIFQHEHVGKFAYRYQANRAEPGFGEYRPMSDNKRWHDPTEE